MGRGKECRGAVMHQVYIPLPATCHWMKSMVMEPQSQCMWMWNKGKAMRALLRTTRTGEQESKMSGPSLKLPENMQGRSCDPRLGLRVAAGSQISLCLYSSCLLWKVHRVWHFRANVKQQGLWFTTGIYLGTACSLCGKAQILQFTAPSCDSLWERPLKRDLQKIQENCPDCPLRLSRVTSLQPALDTLSWPVPFSCRRKMNRGALWSHTVPIPVMWAGRGLGLGPGASHTPGSSCRTLSTDSRVV